MFPFTKSRQERHTQWLGPRCRRTGTRLHEFQFVEVQLKIVVCLYKMTAMVDVIVVCPFQLTLIELYVKLRLTLRTFDITQKSNFESHY